MNCKMAHGTQRTPAPDCDAAYGRSLVLLLSKASPSGIRLAGLGWPSRLRSGLRRARFTWPKPGVLTGSADSLRWLLQTSFALRSPSVSDSLTPSTASSQLGGSARWLTTCGCAALTGPDP